MDKNLQESVDKAAVSLRAAHASVAEQPPSRSIPRHVLVMCLILILLVVLTVLESARHRRVEQAELHQMTIDALRVADAQVQTYYAAGSTLPDALTEDLQQVVSYRVIDSRRYELLVPAGVMNAPLSRVAGQPLTSGELSRLLP